MWSHCSTSTRERAFCNHDQLASAFAGQHKPSLQRPSRRPDVPLGRGPCCCMFAGRRLVTRRRRQRRLLLNGDYLTRHFPLSSGFLTQLLSTPRSGRSCLRTANVGRGKPAGQVDHRTDRIGNGTATRGAPRAGHDNDNQEDTRSTATPGRTAVEPRSSPPWSRRRSTRQKPFRPDRHVAEGPKLALGDRSR